MGRRAGGVCFVGLVLALGGPLVPPASALSPEQCAGYADYCRQALPGDPLCWGFDGVCGAARLADAGVEDPAATPPVLDFEDATDAGIDDGAGGVGVYPENLGCGVDGAFADGSPCYGGGGGLSPCGGVLRPNGAGGFGAHGGSGGLGGPGGPGSLGGQGDGDSAGGFGGCSASGGDAGDRGAFGGLMLTALGLLLWRRRGVRLRR